MVPVPNRSKEPELGARSELELVDKVESEKRPVLGPDMHKEAVLEARPYPTLVGRIGYEI